MRATASDRFWARVDKADGPDACWLWMGTKTNGYGCIRWEGRNQRAHRVAYMLEVGPITEESLDHLCRNKACVNPRHLEQCSLAENNLRSDCVSGINARKTHCNRGHELTPENIRVNEHGRHCTICEQETRPERHRRYKGALSVEKINARIEADRDRRRRRTERLAELEAENAALRGALRELLDSGVEVMDEHDTVEVFVSLLAWDRARAALTRPAPRPEPIDVDVPTVFIEDAPRPSECVVQIMSSRMCERGTKSCVVAHTTQDAIHGSPAPRPEGT